MNNERIERLNDLRKELEQTPPEPWSNIKTWIAKATPIIRKDWPDFLDDFREVTTEPSWLALPRTFGGPSSESSNAQARNTEIGVNRGKSIDAKKGVLNFLTGLLATSPSTPEPSALTIIRLLCERFPIFARQLKTRRTGRDPIKIEDEYDVQYLLHALFRIYFDDVRPEEWTPTYAGASSRMDFLLKNEKIVIEAKMTRDTLKDRQVGEQLIIDINKYSKHPDCRTLVCFVFDPNGLIANPRGLEHDLSGSHAGIEVVVITSPR